MRELAAKNSRIRAMTSFARLRRRIQHEDLSASSWNATQRFVVAWRASREESLSRFRNALRRSQQLLGAVHLDDPLLLDLGMHRWLANEREEAYSDWLAWILGQCSFPEVAQLLGIVIDEETARRCEQAQAQIDREFTLRTAPRRLDVLITYAGLLRIVIEIKLVAAELADLSKNADYAAWLGNECLRDGARQARVLVALEAPATISPGDFTYRGWAEIAVELRRLSRKAARPTALNALFLSFAGAVEQNLLDYDAEVVRKVSSGSSGYVPEALCVHLEESCHD